MNLVNLLNLTEISIFTNLNNIELSGVTYLVARIIEFFGTYGGIAIGVVVFSLMLKIIPLPLDIISRISTKKNALRMERMRPELERLQKQYANNKELYSQKVLALQKKEGYSAFASCLPTIITLVFFIIVINAFTDYSSYYKVETFNEMAREYNNAIIESEYVEEVDGKFYIEEDKMQIVIKNAQDMAANKYIENKEKSKFLWVQNIWLEDLPWKKAFINHEAFKTIFEGKKFKNVTNDLKFEEAFNQLTSSPILDEEKNKPNGLLILVALSIVTMLLSQIVLTKGQKAQMELQSVDGANGQAAQTSKIMMWMMPIMFGIFAFVYSAAFSIYMIISTVFSMGSTFIINKIVEVKFKKQIEREEEEKFNKRYEYLNRKK